MRCSVIVRKIRRKIDKLRYRPIEVYVFHAVSDSFDEALNMRVDWTSTEEFKRNIRVFKEKSQFISLQEAYGKMKKDCVRKKNYAVLTCDDGFKSVLSILPFLEEQQIPVTLFVNPKYLDGKSKREGYAENPQYITKEELWALNSPWITIGMHGYEHNDATRMAEEDFSASIDRCIDLLKGHPRFIPYYAYTWGNYSEMTQRVLKNKHLVPVLTDGESNYRYRKGIGRKPIDSYYLKKK